MRSLLLLLSVTALVACTKPAPPPPPVASSECVADELGELRMQKEPYTGCARQAASCVDRCVKGDADACMTHSHTLAEQGAREESALYLARACQHGLAIACTSYGADVVLAGTPTAKDTACARRLFGAACTVHEPRGCALEGKLMADAVTTPAERATVRAHLEHLCTELPGFTCRIYAYALERGQLGDHTPEDVAELMRRACQGRDVGACGHASAAESFHGTAP